MSDVIKIGAGGVSVGWWLSLVVETVGGFVGDLRLADGSGLYRIAVSLAAGEAKLEGADLTPAVKAALNRRVREMEDLASAREIIGLARVLRRQWKKGTANESSLQGEGVWMDFARGRHRVDFGARLGVLQVHGRTFVGQGFDPSSKIVRIDDKGVVKFADGSSTDVGTLPDAETGQGDEELAEFAADPEAVGFAARLLRARAGSMSGPRPSGGLVSIGEDGDMLVVAAMEAGEGRPMLRIMPGSMQVTFGDTVVFQCACDASMDIAERVGMGTALAALRGEAVEVYELGVEIRTAAS